MWPAGPWATAKKGFDLLRCEYVAGVGSPSAAQASAAGVSIGSLATGKNLGAYYGVFNGRGTACVRRLGLGSSHLGSSPCALRL